MSEFSEHDDVIDAEPIDGEVIAPLPVVVSASEVEPRGRGAVAAVHAAAFTAGGFFAGALAMALAKRFADKHVPAVSTLGEQAQAWPVGTSRTYVVNVRLVARSHE